MKLLQAYSLTSGAKITKPKLPQKFLPLPFEKYIVLQPYSKPSKSYQLWQDVLDIIVPVLNSQNIHVVQVGAANEQPLQGTYYIAGQTNFSQVFYLIQNSLMVLGTDSFALHAAGILDKLCVGLYSNNYLDVVSPYFGDKNKQILLEPDRKGNKPSFSFEENPRTINTISPKLVIEAVFKLLNIKIDKIPNFIYYGTSYLQKIIEIIPDGNVANCQQFGTDAIIVRYDYLNNLDGLIKQLQVCKCSLVTNKTIDINLLKTFKPNIKELIYFIDQESNPEFIKKVRKLGIPFYILYSGPESDIVDKKLDYCEYGLIHCKNVPKSKNDIKELNDYSVDKLLYKSNKLTLFNKKLYPSKAAADLDLSCNGFGGFYKVIDQECFWKETEHFYFLS